MIYDTIQRERKCNIWVVPFINDGWLQFDNRYMNDDYNLVKYIREEEKLGIVIDGSDIYLCGSFIVVLN